MARVALVTGGTRGIGEAISVALKDAGYKVAANYGGNDQAAQDFSARFFPDRNAAGMDLGNIAFLEKHKAPGHRQQRGNIRRDEVLAYADTNHYRAAAAGEDQPVGIVLGHDHQRVGAFQLADRRLDRGQQVVAFL